MDPLAISRKALIKRLDIWRVIPVEDEFVMEVIHDMFKELQLGGLEEELEQIKKMIDIISMMIQ